MIDLIIIADIDQRIRTKSRRRSVRLYRILVKHDKIS